jgi:hypothetical protein
MVVRTQRATRGRLTTRLVKKIVNAATVEQQGHGQTADIERPLSFAHMADDTAELLTQLGVRRLSACYARTRASPTSSETIWYWRSLLKQ